MGLDLFGFYRPTFSLLQSFGAGNFVEKVGSIFSVQSVGG